MKQKLTCLLLALLLSVSLTACGNDKNHSDAEKDDALIGNDTTDGQDNGHASDGTADPGMDSSDKEDSSSNSENPTDNQDSLPEDAKDDAENAGEDVARAGRSILDGVEDTGRDAARAGRSLLDGVEDAARDVKDDSMTTFERMLRNGRVHDTDGDLTDHENAVTPGWD